VPADSRSTLCAIAKNSLKRAGISVETLDLSEVLGRHRSNEGQRDDSVVQKLSFHTGIRDDHRHPQAALVKMAS